MELLTFKRILLAAALGLTVMLSYNNGYDKADAKWKQEVNREYVRKVEATRATQGEVDAVSSKYQDEIAALEGSTDRIIADLRDTNQRLRVSVKATGSPGSDGRCVFDGKAELDEATAKRLIGITKRGDAQIEALQNTIRAMQQRR